MKKWMKIIQRFYKLHDRPVPQDIMPMSIHELGNSSVYLLFDLLIRGQIKDQEINKGDVLLFASVGAGMNVNAFVYRY
jgi:3-oxoacyl-[acyl-carrier-protein] synthase-3